MQMTLDFDQIVAHLRKVRDNQGEESFNNALKSLFRALITKPGADGYIKRLLEAFGMETSFPGLKAEVAASAAAVPSPAGAASPVDVVRQAVQQEMPHCRTQAHFDLVLQAWTALKVYLDACYGLEPAKAAQAREGLLRLLDLAPRVAQLHEKVEQSPEATTNRDYLEPARELTEHHKQQTLLAELGEVDSMDRLQTWYQNVKPIMDSIVSQPLRDELFDAIRAKKHALVN